MTILLIEYRVPDFAEWKVVFDRDPMGRASHGVTRYRIYQDSAGPNHFMLSLEFATAKEATAFRDAMRPVWEVSGGGSVASGRDGNRNVLKRVTQQFCEVKRD